MKLITFILIAFAWTGSAFSGDNSIFTYIDEVSPPPFTLDESLRGEFLKRTGFEPKILIQDAVLFSTDKRVGCVFSASAIRIYEGREMVDHRGFLAIKEKTEKDWIGMELYALPSQEAKRLWGEVTDSVLDRIIDESANPVSREKILEALIRLGGE